MENQIKRISVYGDSILKGAVTGTSSGHLFDIIEENSLALAGKALGLEINNQSVFGSTIVKTQKRLNRDIERNTAADLAIIESGGNDCDYDWTFICQNDLSAAEPRVNLSDFIKITDEMVKTCRANKITPLIMTMPPLVPDRWFTHICNNHDAEKIKAFVKNTPDVLYRNHEKYNLNLLKYCYANNVQFVDMRLAMLEHSNYRNLMCLDGIHPNQDGYKFMAEIWEKELPKIKKEFQVNT
ncbi:MAG: SGNH/GDSL hydrolase family protein [Treponema sp.]